MSISMPNSNFREYEFVAFLAKLLQKSGYKTTLSDVSVGDGRRVDILLESGGSVFIVEVKRTAPQTRVRLEEFVSQIKTYSTLVDSGPYSNLAQRLVLAIPGTLSERAQEMLRAEGVEVWDGAWIAQRAEDAGLQEEAKAFLAEDYFDGASDGQSIDLRVRLSRIPPGRDHWSAYQKLCRDIVEFLFCPPLRSPIWESSNLAGVNKRDLILPNYATDGFWKFMRSEYRADYVVIDAKNYTKGIKKDEVLQIANYLSRHGAGLFAIIITRNAPEESALYTIREQWICHNKMIVALQDSDILQMLTDASFGNDPSEVLRQKIEDFRLHI